MKEKIMPELPEVETIRRGLEKVIVGKKIEKFESRDPKVVRFAPEEIEGCFVSGVERKAKILVLRLSKSNVISTPQELRAEESSNNELLSEDLSTPLHSARDDIKGEKLMLIHLKMTGQLIWEECSGKSEFCLKKSRVVGGHPSPDWVAKLPNAYTRAIFHFGDESVLFFNDLRRFGYMKLYDLNSSRVANAPSNSNYSSSEVEKLDIPELSKLGPEPFSDEFTAEYLMRRAAKIPNRKIKQFITDQEVISGVGNIYVDEALFYAGILPTRAVKDISVSEWGKVRDAIIKSLELGLKYGGSSEDTYVDAFGNQGAMSDHTRVYRRTGQNCQTCGTKIERITLGGRGTHFCPKCQK